MSIANVHCLFVMRGDEIYVYVLILLKVKVYFC